MEYKGGNSIDVCQSGRQKKDEYFQPILIIGPPVPDDSMKKIFRQFSKDCGSYCGCRKTGNPLAFMTT